MKPVHRYKILPLETASATRPSCGVGQQETGPPHQGLGVLRRNSAGIMSVRLMFELRRRLSNQHT